MDKSKLHKKHKPVFDQLMSATFIPQRAKEQIYAIWVELNKHPENEWASEEVKERVSEIATAVREDTAVNK